MYPSFVFIEVYHVPTHLFLINLHHDPSSAVEIYTIHLSFSISFILDCVTGNSNVTCLYNNNKCINH